MKSGPETTIVGAGGIGCALGHALLSGGVEVTLKLAGDGDFPLNREVYDLVKRVEENGLESGRQWLDELLRGET